jgi:hypothetical protein
MQKGPASISVFATHAKRQAPIQILRHMAKSDEIDRLFQLPLEEFTDARNALAKQLGDAAPEIKRLQKPNVAAWAVNQLFWKRQKTFQSLIQAAEKLRAAHRQTLAGKSGNIRDAEAAHRAAVRTATGEVRQLMDAAGVKSSPAMLSEITETLDALPTSDTPGRWTKPLKRMGFEALSGLSIAPGGSDKSRPAAPIPFPTRKAAPSPRDTRDTKKEAAKLKERIREARGNEREADATVEQVERDIERTAREHQRLTRQIDDLAAALEKLQSELPRRQRARLDAAAKREQLEEDLKKLT